jgi:hypothetical protein
MGRPSFRIRVGTLVDRVRARVSVSPDIWDDASVDGRGADHHVDDVSDWLDLPPDFRAPDADEVAYLRSTRLDLGRLDLDEAEEDLDDARWSIFE